MPSQERYLETLADKYLAKKTKRGKLSEKNADAYRARIIADLNTLKEAGFHFTPKQIGEQEIDHLLNVTYKKARTKYKRWEISILNGFLEFYGNQVIDDMMIGWPQDARVNVDWLSEEEAILMLDAARGVERIVIHLELWLWLRRVEVLRLKSKEIQDGFLNVHGKGKFGGKWRTIAFAIETPQEIQYYEMLREEVIEKAKRKNPDVIVPEDWIIYGMGGTLHPYSESGIDSIVARVGKRAGIQRTITNHTLRRTGARIMYRAKVDPALISVGLGHSSWQETVQYLGLTVEELAQAQVQTYEYLNQFRERLKNGMGQNNVNRPAMARISR